MFCTAKRTINRVKKKPAEWEIIFPNHMSDKGLASIIYDSYTSIAKWQIFSMKKNNCKASKWEIKNIYRRKKS